VEKRVLDRIEALYPHVPAGEWPERPGKPGEAEGSTEAAPDTATNESNE
jgi:hypothetical protein